MRQDNVMLQIKKQHQNQHQGEKRKPTTAKQQRILSLNIRQC